MSVFRLWSILILVLTNQFHIKHPPWFFNLLLFILFYFIYLFFIFFAAFFTGTESKMKLWDVLATCLLLLSSVATRPLYQNTQPAKRTNFPSSYSDSASLSVEDEEPTFQREDHNLQEISMEDQCKAHSMFKQNLLWCAGTVMASWMVGNWRTRESLHRSVLLVQNLCEITCD